MEKPPFQIQPAALTAVGALMVWITTFLTWDSAGHFRWALLVGGALALGGVFWFYCRRYEPDRKVREERESVENERRLLSKERKLLEVIRNEIEAEAVILEKRRQKLGQELAQTLSWWDSSEPLSNQGKGPSVSELHDKDRQVVALCREESERVFNKIIENAYMQDGRLKTQEIVQDVTRLFEGVALIYRPDSDQPLLDTSLEQLLRFLHTTSLQILVQVEQLPIDVKKYNLREVYSFVKKGMDYYGLYKTIAPYWNYAKPAFFLGRVALGANPITLGIGWTLSEIASRGGKKLSTRYSRKYGLRLFHESIRILGTEAAAVYGAHYRHRDPDWIYALELTELAAHFPPSVHALEATLTEIGELPMRSEHDRVFLFRCIATHVSARPDQFRSHELMRGEDKMKVVQRLEDMLTQHFDGTQGSRVQEWKHGLETRLGVKINLGGDHEDLTLEQQQENALYSLFSYLHGPKMLEMDSAEPLLKRTQIAASMNSDTLTNALLRIRETPPMLFDYPNLETSSSLLPLFFRDLIQLQLSVFPYTPDLHLIEEASFYFRHDLKLAREELERQSVERVRFMIDETAPSPRIDAHMACGSLTRLQKDERVRFLYINVVVEGSVEFTIELARTWLIGTSEGRLLILVQSKNHQVPGKAVLLWQGSLDEVEVESVKGIFGQDCRLLGGQWNKAILRWKGDSPRVRIKGKAGAGFDRYFYPLLPHND